MVFATRATGCIFALYTSGAHSDAMWPEVKQLELGTEPPNLSSLYQKFVDCSLQR